MNKSRPLFVLVDGSSYLFRAYHALPPLTNSSGQPTGAIFGVLNMLKKLLVDYHPAYIAVIFDSKTPTFRHQLYTAYKANRVAMPDELSSQIQPLFEIIQALGLPLIVKPGYEADDIIATLAQRATQEGCAVLISTTDKDLTQIVTKDIHLINTMSDQTLDPAGVKKKFGVTPQQMIDYLTLMGDASDNIPGIPKVGPKTAQKWLEEYGSLDNIIKHAPDISGKVGESFREHIETIPVMKKLVSIQTDVPLSKTETLNHLVAGKRDEEKLLHWFSTLEFKKWLTEISNKETVGDKLSHKYHTILDKQSFNAWLKKLELADQFAFDTETTSLDAMNAALVGMSFALDEKEAIYIPVAHDYANAPKQLDKKWVLQQLQPILNDSKKLLIGQNIKYDLEVLANENMHLKTRMADTMLESYILNNAQAHHDLNTLSMKYLERTPITFEDVAGKGKNQITFNQVAIDKATDYAAEDAQLTWQLHHRLMPELQKNKILVQVFENIEMPLMPILAVMEYHGVLIDTEFLHQQSQSLAKRMKTLEEKIFKYVGYEFNIQSPKQLQTILYEKLNLPHSKKTPTGQASTDESVLKELALQYPLPKLILEHRSLSKLKSTYTDRLPEQVNPKTKRVHTSYHQAVTSTGRLSSQYPNLQNIPTRTEDGRKIRQAFIAPHGYRLISADYSQVELRIIAHITQDPNLIHAFQKKLDIHRATASEVFDVPLDKVTDEQRRHAKTINFGLLYGMSSFGLGQQLGIDRHVAQEYIDIYFKRYPKVHQYIEDTRKLAKKQGYVETLFGRRVYVPEIHSGNRFRQQAAERAAINAPMQGTAADIIKLAMIRAHEWLTTTSSSMHMIMQVHDELIFEIPEKDVDRAIPAIQEAMEGAAKFTVPLIVDIGIGKNWDEAH